MVRCVDRSPKLTEVWSAYNWFYSRTLLGKEDSKVEKREKEVSLVILRNLLNLPSAFLALVLSKTKKTQSNPNSNPVTQQVWHLPTGEKVTFKAKNLMNLSRSFLSWELRSVSIAYGNLKYSTGMGMNSSFRFLFLFQDFKIILPLEATSNDKHQRPLPVKIVTCSELWGVGVRYKGAWMFYLVSTKDILLA